ncbi:MAG: cytochrome P450 [Dehalococcoidia bacterium]
MAIFNPFLPSFERNPYPAYASLRASDPVHWSETLGAWVLTTYEDCDRVLRDPKRFSNNPLNASVQVADAIRERRRELPLGMVPTVLNSDGEVHARLRGIVSRAFTPRVVEGLGPRIAEVAEFLLDAAPSSGAFDLVRAFSEVLPVVVIAELLGVPADDRPLFRRWATAIAATTRPMPTPGAIEDVKVAATELIEYMTKVIEERQREPREDLISALVRAEGEEARLSRDELLAFITVLLVAGHETTTHLIGNGMHALLQAPEQLALLRAEPTLIPAAVEELLRLDSPVQALVRIATESVEFRERRIEAGAVLLVMIGAANRDPARFAEPDRLDVRRADNDHLAFGRGPHFCLGAPLARLEGRIAFEALLRHYPSIAAAGTPERSSTFVLRGMRSLPVSV